VLTGTPRTAELHLGAPRPAYRLTLHNDGQARTIEVQRADVTAVVGRATLLHVPASPENEAFLHSTMFLDGYEFSIRITWAGDDVTATLLDDLAPRVPVSAARVAEWEESWAGRLAKMEAAPNAGA
jgi:hypothetical protein